MSSETLDCKNIICRGRVQGVFYRASTVNMAKSLGLNGWVRNLDNGDVEILAQGLEGQMLELINWCKRGPEFATVSEVIITPVSCDESFETFEITY
ncbi:MAG: acylphosphatase [Cyclobacteriaceae bacterium]